MFTVPPQADTAAIISAASSSTAVTTGLCHLSSVLIQDYDCLSVAPKLV